MKNKYLAVNVTSSRAKSVQDNPMFNLKEKSFGSYTCIFNSLTPARSSLLWRAGSSDRERRRKGAIAVDAQVKCF